ncbi:PhzF family phenazine biosynthesis protein [Kineosporia succinea]|uniref:PhzF family phenazine biosynthesis protein n=1 Tax=Kineosporia succinea TaxID=84632 RepID=A0ABT9PBS3_9ACTN|nr:PhzF family phenazine biosynthesis protein [Kineosporia succinea]MDP9830152.1 PhzF family phenazine biosynthesis protein [Kineosporia succinea]
MQVQRISAFTRDPGGGNPAGVVISDQLPDEATMQRVAAEVGYSETAFVAVRPGTTAADVRYFSPEREVEFCGHATIASAVALAEIHGPATFEFHTRAGLVPVSTAVDDGHPLATLTSVSPQVHPVPDDLLARLLPLLGWSEDDLDPDLSPALSYAGAWHFVAGLRELPRLEALEYDFAGVRELMLKHGLTTLQLVHRTGPSRFRARNPFPVGGVVEDPATGAAAAALGAYLRHFGLLELPARLTITQGVEMGRPSTLHVDVPVDGGIRVSGNARRID